MTKLYDIPMEFAELEEALVESAGELTPELEARFDEFLKAGKDKIEAGAMVVRGLELEAEACVEEAKRLTQRSQAATKNADRLKALVLRAVDFAFEGKVKTKLFTIWGQTSAPVVKFDLDPETTLEGLGHEFPMLVRVKRELDTSALKDMQKAGGVLPDGLLVTTLPGTRYLRIK
jgi:hypothetical protein